MRRGHNCSTLFLKFSFIFKEMLTNLPQLFQPLHFSGPKDGNVWRATSIVMGNKAMFVVLIATIVRVYTSDVFVW